jgi:hypothetical protein
MPNSVGMTPMDRSSNVARAPKINPNMGKVVTGPSGGQFDFTQATKSPSTLSPTSGPNVFINGNTGQAMQPRPKAEINARYSAQRSNYQAGRAKGLAQFAASKPATTMSPQFSNMTGPQ